VKNVGSVGGVTSSEAAVKQDFGPALAAQPKRPVSFFLYFLADTDEFAPESRALVNQIFAEIARRTGSGNRDHRPHRSRRAPRPTTTRSRSVAPSGAATSS
jgi:hypothetical protein